MAKITFYQTWGFTTPKGMEDLGDNIYVACCNQAHTGVKCCHLVSANDFGPDEFIYFIRLRPLCYMQCYGLKAAGFTSFFGYFVSEGYIFTLILTNRMFSLTMVVC